MGGCCLKTALIGQKRSSGDYEPGAIQIALELDHQQPQEALQRVECAVGDLAPLMRGVAAELGSATE